MKQCLVSIKILSYKKKSSKVSRCSVATWATSTLNIFHPGIPSSKFQLYVNAFFPPTCMIVESGTKFFTTLVFFLLRHVWLAMSATNTSRVTYVTSYRGFDFSEQSQRFNERCSWSVYIISIS